MGSAGGEERHGREGDPLMARLVERGGLTQIEEVGLDSNRFDIEHVGPDLSNLFFFGSTRRHERLRGELRRLLDDEKLSS